jgi:hypothetical protein
MVLGDETIYDNFDLAVDYRSNLIQIRIPNLQEIGVFLSPKILF